MPVLAIPVIAVVIAALFALLIYYGVELIGKVIKSWTPSIGIPGIGNLRDIVSQLVDDAMGVVRTIMHGAVHAIVHFIESTAIWALKMFDAVVQAAADAAAGLFRIVTVHLPQAIVRMMAFAQAVAYQVKAELGARVGQLRADVHGWLNDVRGWATTLVSAAVAELSTRLHQLRADLSAGLDGVRAFAAGLVSTLAVTVAHELAALRDWTSQHILRVEADLSNAVHGLEADIATGVGIAEHQAATMVHDLTAAVSTGVLAVDIPGVPELVSGLIDDVGGLVGVIGSDLPQLGDLVKSLDLSGALDIAGIATGTLVLERVLTRYLRDCGVPNCRNLSGLGHFIEDLLGAASLAALLAMLADIISDPEGAARTAVDELSGVFDGASTLARDLLGV